MIDIPIFFMAGDLNSNVFKSKNSVGMEKVTLYFAVGTRLLNHFQHGQILDNFPLGMIFWPIFPVGRGSHRVCEKGVSINYTIFRQYISRPILLAKSQNVKLPGQSMTSSRNMADFGSFWAIMGGLNDKILQRTPFSSSTFHDLSDKRVEIPF